MHRVHLSELRAALADFPVVALLGPRQVGKTTLATALADSLGADKVRYIDMESPADRARLGLSIRSARCARGRRDSRAAH